jgi:hypothetical protein
LLLSKAFYHNISNPKSLAKKILVQGTNEFLRTYDSLSIDNPVRKSIDYALDRLKENLLAGDKIQKNLWPKKYIKEHKINNLFRYGLVEGYRLTYAILSDNKTTTSVILEALDHDSYDDRFGYQTS